MKIYHFLTLVSFLLLAACEPSDTTVKQAAGEESGGVYSSEMTPAADTMYAPSGNPNAVAIPREVQDNLGMSFAAVERRVVEGVHRVPGQFELLPEARREYHVMLEGRITLHVKQFDEVQEGDLLATLDSPSWRALQHSAVEAEGEIRVAEAGVEVARARLTEVESAIGFLSQRIAKLQEAQVRQINLESEMSELHSQKPRLAAELNASDVALDEAREHYLSRLRTMSSVTGLTREQLLAEVENGDAIRPHWHTIEQLEIRAAASGVVEMLDATNGAWLETGAHTLATVDPYALRFAAQAPQSDMPIFQNGQTVRIVPPSGGSIGDAAPIAATLRVGFVGHAEERLIPLYAEVGEIVPWAKAGISAYMEVITGEATPQLAIPEAALVRDELDVVFFKRDSKNPNEAIKVKADLGLSDGKWVAVKSGVKDGDEVVVQGAYALKLAGSKNTAPPGYHYHADGALHQNH